MLLNKNGINIEETIEVVLHLEKDANQKEPMPTSRLYNAREITLSNISSLRCPVCKGQNPDAQHKQSHLFLGTETPPPPFLHRILNNKFFNECIFTLKVLMFWQYPRTNVLVYRSSLP